ASERFQPGLELRASLAPPAFALELLEIRHREEQIVPVDDPAELRGLCFDSTRHACLPIAARPRAAPMRMGRGSIPSPFSHGSPHLAGRRKGGPLVAAQVRAWRRRRLALHGQLAHQRPSKDPRLRVTLQRPWTTPSAPRSSLLHRPTNRPAPALSSPRSTSTC